MTPKFVHAMTAKTVGAKRVRELLRTHPYLEQRAAQLSDLDRNLNALCRMVAATIPRDSRLERTRAGRGLERARAPSRSAHTRA